MEARAPDSTAERTPPRPPGVNTPLRLIEACREDFPALQQTIGGHPLIYFDNAATTHKPQSVIDAISDFYRADNANVHRGPHQLSQRATDRFERARARTAQFLHARSSDEIIFTRGTTDAINLVAQSWGAQHLRPGDRVLLTEMEHHSNLVPWQMLALRCGAVLEYLPVSPTTGLVPSSEVARRLRPPVKLFAAAHISNVLGTINPIAEWCEIARAHGITTVIDAAQSVGHQPVNVQQLQCDFLAFSAHKTYGPTGLGVLYGRRELLATMPPIQGGGDMITQVGWTDHRWADPPARFEAGTPDIAGAIGLQAALEYLDALGRERIQRYESGLAEYARDELLRLEGIRVLGPAGPRGSLTAFTWEGLHPYDVATLADQWGLALRSGHHCAQPLAQRMGLAASVRASFAFYNTTAEVDRMIEILQEVRRACAA